MVYFIPILPQWRGADLSCCNTILWSHRIMSQTRKMTLNKKNDLEETRRGLHFFFVLSYMGNVPNGVPFPIKWMFCILSWKNTETWWINWNSLYPYTASLQSSKYDISAGGHGVRKNWFSISNTQANQPPLSPPSNWPQCRPTVLKELCCCDILKK